MLYTVYNLPNIFLPLIGGFLTDKFGDRLMTLIFGFLILIGQTVVVYGS